MNQSTSADNMTNLNRVVGYCENVVDCRRVLQLQYFGETFDANMCNKTCDNCNQYGERISKDVTADAKNFAQLVKAVGNGQLTLKQFLDILGSKAASGKGQAGAQWAGKGKEWKKEDVERLSHLLVIEDVFAEEVRTGYKNSQAVYISLGRNAYNLLNNKMKLTMSFRGRAKTPTKPQKQDVPAAVDSSSNELRVLQQELYLRLFNARKEIQTTIHANEYLNEYAILSTDQVQELSSSMPTNEAELTTVLGDVKARKYSKILLPAIQNFMDQSHLTKLPNGTMCIRGVPANGTQNNNNTTNKNNNTANKPNNNNNTTNKSNNNNNNANDNNPAKDLDAYRYNGGNKQSSPFFARETKRKLMDNQADSSTKKLKQSGNLNQPSIHHSFSTATSAMASAKKGGIMALQPTRQKLPPPPPQHQQQQNNKQLDNDFDFEPFKFHQ